MRGPDLCWRRLCQRRRYHARSESERDHKDPHVRLSLICGPGRKWWILGLSSECFLSCKEVANHRDAARVFLHGEVPDAVQDMDARARDLSCPELGLTGKGDPVSVTPQDQRFVGYPAQPSAEIRVSHAAVRFPDIAQRFAFPFSRREELFPRRRKRASRKISGGDLRAMRQILQPVLRGDLAEVGAAMIGVVEAGR